MKAFCKSFGKNTLVYAIVRKIRVVTAIVIILVGFIRKSISKWKMKGIKEAML